MKQITVMGFEYYHEDYCKTDLSKATEYPEYTDVPNVKLVIDGYTYFREDVVVDKLEEPKKKKSKSVEDKIKDINKKLEDKLKKLNEKLVKAKDKDKLDKVEEITKIIEETQAKANEEIEKLKGDE